jgi:hypothetical protein
MSAEWDVNNTDKSDFARLLAFLRRVIHTAEVPEKPALLDTSDCLPYSQPLIRRR